MIPAIFINSKEYPFVKWIIDGSKRYETRNSNTLGAFVGQRVLIAETGHGRPLVKCSAVIAESIEIRSYNEWRTFISAYDVPLFSSYDWKPDTKRKVIYKLSDVRQVAPFTPEGERHGRVWMECDNAPQEMDNTDRMAIIDSIIEIFEDFLEAKRIDIPNYEKADDPNASTIYGCDYGILYDHLEELLFYKGILKRK